MQGQNVPVYAKGESYKYLGYKISIDNTSSQTNELIIKFVDTITKVNSSCLPTSAKLEAINTMCLSLLHFYMPNLLFLEKDLLFLEDTIVKSIREYLKLNNSSTRSYFFLPKSMGGLGILNPKLLYYTSHISFYLSVLNSDDPIVRQTARHSLDLHMKKRKAVEIENSEEDNFAGFLIENKKIVKNSKAIWPKSDWQHLFEMCQREGIRLLKNDDLYVLSFELDDDISFQTHLSFAFKKSFKSKNLKQFETSR